MRKLAIISIGIVTLSVFAPIEHTVDVEIKLKHPVKVQTKATMAEKKANRITALRYAQVGFGYDKVQRSCLSKLWYTESRWDHLAKNQQGSSAFGIAQLLGETSKDPEIQILKGLRYISKRYSTPCRAYYWHLKRNWY